MIDRWIVNLVIMFALKQIGKFKGSIDWAAVRADADERVRQLIPGVWFDDEAASVVSTLIDGVELVLSAQKELEWIMKQLASGDYQGSLESLKRLLIGIWQPPATAPGVRAAKALVA